MRKVNWLLIIKSLLFTLSIIIILCYIVYHKDISIQTIIEYTPENTLAAALILLLMYAIKSISIIFPLIILEVAVGHLFAPIPAIIINTLGIMIGHIIAYWIGYFVGTVAMDKLIKKHAFINSVIQKQEKNSYFACFFLRTLYCLPGDIVSMYLGAAKTPFKRYIVASTLGSFPSTILATILGASIAEVFSPMFWVSIILMTLFAGSSLIVHYFYKKSQKDNASQKIAH